MFDKSPNMHYLMHLRLYLQTRKQSIYNFKNSNYIKELKLHFFNDLTALIHTNIDYWFQNYFLWIGIESTNCGVLSVRKILFLIGKSHIFVGLVQFEKVTSEMLLGHFVVDWIKKSLFLTSDVCLSVSLSQLNEKYIDWNSKSAFNKLLNPVYWQLTNSRLSRAYVTSTAMYYIIT